MKAIVITRPGGPEVLEIRDVADPEILPGHVLVRVAAAGVNRADVLQRMGRYPAPPGYPADIPGLEFAGEVAEPSHSQGWQAGTRVFGITAGGAQAQYVSVPPDHLTRIPDNISFVAAAAVPEVFITAHDALFTRAGLRSGETVLVHAAGSGVGLAAIQLAHANGARVFGTSRTAEKLERAKPYGLSDAIAVGDDLQKMVAAVREWTDGAGVDVVLDLVGAKYLEANLSALAPKGRMIFVGTTSGSKATLDFSTVMGKRLTVMGTMLRGRSNSEKAEATRLFAEQVVPLLANGSIQPVIDRVYKMNESREAHQRMEANENFGKIVLEIE